MTNTDKQTEEKIFEAATIVFEEKGLTGARMQNIADRAGFWRFAQDYEAALTGSAPARDWLTDASKIPAQVPGCPFHFLLSMRTRATVSRTVPLRSRISCS